MHARCSSFSTRPLEIWFVQDDDLMSQGSRWGNMTGVPLHSTRLGDVGSIGFDDVYDVSDPTCISARPSWTHVGSWYQERSIEDVDHFTTFGPQKSCFQFWFKLSYCSRNLMLPWIWTCDNLCACVFTSYESQISSIFIYIRIISIHWVYSSHSPLSGPGAKPPSVVAPPSRWPRPPRNRPQSRPRCRRRNPGLWCPGPAHLARLARLARRRSAELVVSTFTVLLPTCQVRACRFYILELLSSFPSFLPLLPSSFPQQRPPDLSGHCWTSTANSRSQWALPTEIWRSRLRPGRAQARENVRMPE